MLKKGYLFLIILVCFFAISAVSAEDNSTSDIVSLSNDVNSLEANSAKDEFSSTNYVIDQLESDSGNGTGTFHDLQVEINNAPKGSVLNLTRDYKGAYGSSIEFNKDLTINGQGHTLDCLGERSCSAFYSNSGKITLKNLIIINGRDYFNDYGGAISIKDSAQYTIINCTFNNNWAKGFGGAIYNKANKPLTIINCTFNNNWAEGFGGAIYNEVNKLPTIINCIFNNNTANRGGAICTKSNVKVDNSTFLNSHARDIGGAIYAEDSVNIEDSIFSGNTAYIDGGAIYTGKSVSVTNTIFKNNRAEGVMGTRCYGGAIRSKGDVIVNNIAFNDNYADYGGAIYAEDSVKSVDSIFSGNSAYVDGGAIYAGGNINLKNSTFDNNKAEGASVYQCYSGAIRSKGDVKIDNCSFLNNHAYDYGGAIYADSITWINSPSYFIGNYVNNKKGGAIYTNKFSTNVKYGVFINNTAKGKDDGGAIYINNKNEITFSQCVFVNNRCGDEGGAIYLDSSSSKLSLVNNIFISNSAKAGQTVYNCGEYGTIKNNWWGGNNPSSKNDQLIEWKIWPRSNVHHSDSEPLELLLKLSENTCKINTTVSATAGFYNKDGSLCSGEMITEYISFIPTSDIEFSNRTDEKAYVTILVSPQKEGQYNITANLFGQLASDVLIAVNDSQYRQEYAFNSADVVTILPNDEELFGLPNEVYELPFSLLNEPSGGLIDSPNDEVLFGLLNEPSERLIDSPNNSYNVLVNNEYNVAIDSNVEANNENTNLFSAISNVENSDHTNSTNKTPNKSSVAKTIDNQSNGSSFNYLWILLLIAIFAGAGVLIKQYKN